MLYEPCFCPTRNSILVPPHVINMNKLVKLSGVITAAVTSWSMPCEMSQPPLLKSVMMRMKHKLFPLTLELMLSNTDCGGYHEQQRPVFGVKKKLDSPDLTGVLSPPTVTYASCRLKDCKFVFQSEKTCAEDD
ncbi:unnamed protein product [Brassica rapa subsp. trilocularis]